MKNLRNTILLLLMLTITACQKEKIPNQLQSEQEMGEQIISVEQAKSWLKEQPDSITKKYPIRWERAKLIPTKTGNRIVLRLPGKPTINGTKLGYRQLSIQKNPETKNMEAKVLEIIPDPIYWQGKGKVESRDFTGRILEFDLGYKLLTGRIYDKGKQIGEARPSTPTEKQAYLKDPGQLQPLETFEQTSEASPTHGKIARMAVIESCMWYSTTYIDSEGIFTVYAERMCSYSFYDDGGGSGGGYNDPGISTEQPSGGGGGGSSDPSDPTPPPPSELPMENQAKVDPKKMMDCFGNISGTNAYFRVKVLVLEPQPGTSFNVGQNGFGHVALQLTKSSQGQVITQNIGFYPTGSGLDKLVSKSRMIDNGGLEYTMSATYSPNAQDFQKLIDYISSPPADYHYTDFNCAAFVYQAGKAGNIPIPDPTTQIGFGGPGGAGFAMTPAGMGSALNAQKASNPSADISNAGGRASASKGECK
jgi:hypothetical protein